MWGGVEKAGAEWSRRNGDVTGDLCVTLRPLMPVTSTQKVRDVAIVTGGERSC